MTLAAVCLTSLLQFVQNQPWGFGFVATVGAVRAEEPLWLSLLRTPSSLFVPALDLPVWGRSCRSSVCSVSPRSAWAGGARSSSRTPPPWPGPCTPGWASPSARITRSGCRRRTRAVVDTGPSAAVIGLALFLCWRYRAHLTGGLVIGAMTAELALKQNLAGKEHIAAIAGC